LQISPLVVNGFKNGFHQWIQRSFLVEWRLKSFFPEIFFCFRNLDALYRPVAGKPFVLEVLCLDMGTSVASDLTAETIFEIRKGISDVDMPARVRMGVAHGGQDPNFSCFFTSGYAHDRNIWIFRRRASTVTGNPLIKPNYASVRQSRDSVHRDRHNMTIKKLSRGGAVL